MQAKYELPFVTTYVGADGRTLSFYAKDENGAAIDLTGYTSATISARLGQGAAQVWKIEASTAAIAVGTTGLITYTPTAAELDAEGDYVAQIRLLASTAVDYLEPMILRVVEPCHYTAPAP